MVEYGQEKKYLTHIERVDYFPEIAGVKISNFPIIFVLSIVPLWFDQMIVSLGVLFFLIAFFYHAGRREDEGRPIFLNAKLLMMVSKLPRPVRSYLTPSLSVIKVHKQFFRR